MTRVRIVGRMRWVFTIGVAVALTLGATACEFGSWNANPNPSPVRAVHAALLPTGKVLLVEGSGNDVNRFDAGTFKSAVWDPVTDTFQVDTTPYDLFCAGHAFLPDGRLLVMGGTADYNRPGVPGATDYAGSKHSTIFNPWTEQYETGPDMGVGRWYPTAVTLGDGRILAVSGTDEDRLLTNTHEIFADGAWGPATTNSGGQYFPTYPSLHLMADGRLFYSGVSTFGVGNIPGGFWDLTADTYTALAVPQHDSRDQGASVMLPPAQDQKVMIIGGGHPDGRTATTSTAIIDLDAPNPAWTAGPPLDQPKMYVSAVILPDKTVLQTNGYQQTREASTHTAARSTQIYNPQTGVWKKMFDPSVPRTYHSEAILLPDGRVATFGGNPSDGSFEMRIEIFTPAYLQQDGLRPTIASGPTELARNQPAHYVTTQDRPISSVVLVRPSAMTHSTDPDQRLVDVPFTTTPDGFDATVDVGQTLAPSGWYMLFAVDSLGVPSVAKWVHVTE